MLRWVSRDSYYAKYCKFSSVYSLGHTLAEISRSKGQSRTIRTAPSKPKIKKLSDRLKKPRDQDIIVNSTANAGAKAVTSLEGESIDLKNILPFVPAGQKDRVQELLKDFGPQLDLKRDQPFKSGQAEQDAREVDLETEDTELESSKQTFDYAANLLEQTFNLIDLDDGLFHKELWNNLIIFSKIRPSLDNTPPYELLVRIYQYARLQPEKYRYKCIILTGDLLYSYNTVRLDPYNEADYLQAMSESGLKSKAIRLWESRQGRADVENSIFWREAGALLFLSAHQMSGAENIAEEMDQRFGYISPKIVTGFLAAYCESRQEDKIMKWFDRLLTDLHNNDGPGEPEIITGDLTQEDAEIEFNKKYAPTKEHLLSILDVLLKNSYAVHALKLVESMAQYDIKPPISSILSALDMVTRKLVRHSPGTYGHKLSATESKAAFQAIDQIISHTVASTPDIIIEPRFYNIWLRALGALGEYKSSINVMESMMANEIKPSASHIHGVMKALLSERRLQQAEQLLTLMEKSLEKQDEERQDRLILPSPTEIHYALFIKYAARRKMPKYVAEIVDRMAKKSIALGSSYYAALLYFNYRQRYFATAFKIWNEIEVYSGPITADMYRIMWMILRDYQRTPKTENGSLVEPPNQRSLVQSMLKASSIKPTMELYQLAVESLLLSGDSIAALGALYHMTHISGIAVLPSFIACITQIIGKGRVAQAPLVRSKAVESLILEQSRERNSKQSSINPKEQYDLLKRLIAKKYEQQGYEDEPVDNAIHDFNQELYNA